MFKKSRFSILQLFMLSYAIGGLIYADANQEIVLEKRSLLLKAERLFSEKLYDDALSYYSEIVFLLPEEQKKLKDHLLCRISTCHLEMNRPLNAVELLLERDLSQRNLRREKAFLPHNPTALYLLGRSYGKLGKFAEGLEALSQIPTALDDSKSIVALEKGILFSQLGDLTSAQAVLKGIPLTKTDPRPFLLAQLQLAKNYLSINDWEEAQKTLSSLSELTPGYRLLEKERIYLEGLLFMETDAPEQVIRSFGQLSQKEQLSKPFIEILCQCYFKQALRGKLPKDELPRLLHRTEQLLQHLMQSIGSEQTLEMLSTFYLIKSRTLHDEQAYTLALESLSRLYNAQSEERQQMILLKQAEAAPTYQERNRLYIVLTGKADASPIFLARGYTLKGLNHFFEGMRHRDKYNKEAMAMEFEEAIQAFNLAIDLFPSEHTQEVALTSKYKILAHAMQNNTRSIKEGWEESRILLKTPQFMENFRSPDEIYSLAAWIALQTTDENIWTEAKESLAHLFNQPSTPSPSNIIGKQLYIHLCLKLNQTAEADKILNLLLEDPNGEKFRGQLLLLLAYSAELQQKKELKQHYLQRAFTEDPTSPAAPIAYFHLYSYSDYVWGNRHILKHLQAMPSRFPSHPLLINAYYLIGLCQKKEQLSEEGQVLRRKNLISAIDAFHRTEITFDSLVEKKLIPGNDLDYCKQVRQRAQLERAQANFAIAQQSTGGKREIYLEYAEEVYKELISKLTSLSSTEIKVEAQFHLAQTLNEMEKSDEAEKWLERSIEESSKKGLTKGYWLMKTWHEKGKLLKKRGSLALALQAFFKAEESSSIGDRITPDEKLDIWIEQSLCYREMGQFDQSMRLLSRVINDDVISSRRIKAMYLRAEVYELQNRPELALKQLESTARKGGEWSQKAQKKLEENYGY